MNSATNEESVPNACDSLILDATENKPGNHQDLRPVFHLKSGCVGMSGPVVSST